MAAIADSNSTASQEDQASALLHHQSQALKFFLSDPTASIATTAHELTLPTIEVQRRAKEDRGTLEHFDRFKLWEQLADAIRSHTNLNDRLVELVCEIQQISDEDDTFTSMAGFSMYWTEFAFDFQIPRSDDPERTDKKQGWVNMNAFCAKLSRSRVPELDQRSRSAWTMKEALEKAPWEQASHPDLEEMLEEDPDDEVVAEEVAYEYECRKITVLEFWVPAAAAWMKNDSQGIYEMQGRISVADEEGWEQTLWTGRKGWSEERFKFWSTRFRLISDMEQLSQSTRAEATHTARCMENVLEIEL